METTIYYFTGAGNSLAGARRIAGRLDDAELIPLPRALKEGIGPRGEKIGLFFPVYAYGLPRMVEDYVKRASFPAGAYIFAVASCFSIPGNTLGRLDRLLRRGGVRLDAGFAVSDERSSLLEDPENPVQRMMIGFSRGESPGRIDGRIDEIATAVSAGTPHRPERSNRITCLAGDILHPLALSSFRRSAENFHARDSCGGCGVCARICPRNNILMMNNRPVWGADCEMCHACIQWCPEEAVEYGGLTPGRIRYRNPEVSIRDMYLR